MTIRQADRVSRESIGYLDNLKCLAKSWRHPYATLDEIRGTTLEHVFDYAMHAECHVGEEYDWERIRPISQIIAILDEAIASIKENQREYILLAKYTDRNGNGFVVIRDHEDKPVQLCIFCAEKRGFDTSVDPEDGFKSLEHLIDDEILDCYNASYDDSSEDDPMRRLCYPSPEACDDCRMELWWYDCDYFPSGYKAWLRETFGIKVDE